LHFLNQSQI